MDPDDTWWDVALRYDLERKLQPTPNLVFFGEVYGKIKNFRYDAAVEGGRALPRVRFFDVWDVAAGRFLDVDARLRLIADAELDSVPVLYRGQWLGRDAMCARGGFSRRRWSGSTPRSTPACRSSSSARATTSRSNPPAGPRRAAPAAAGWQSCRPDWDRWPSGFFAPR
jgi:hypothetical protein